jgi:hypothetical protein
MGIEVGERCASAYCDRQSRTVLQPHQSESHRPAARVPFSVVRSPLAHPSYLPAHPQDTPFSLTSVRESFNPVVLI